MSGGPALAYERVGSGPAVVALHGWPGSREDHRDVAEALGGEVDLVLPDLRGFGETGGDGHAADLAPYGADGQAEAVLALVEQLGLERPVLVGYDVGSRVAQAVARRRPDAVRALVIAPPLPGVRERILDGDVQREYWYQPFHRLPLAHELIDGRPDAVRAYLRHFWTHWSAPGWQPDPARLDALVAAYARPGAFAASIAWYRAGAGTVAHALAEGPPDPAARLAIPTTVLWGEAEPLFPVAWADRIDEHFADAELRVLPGVGHFAPLEAPAAVAAAVRERARR